MADLQATVSARVRGLGAVVGWEWGFILSAERHTSALSSHLFLTNSASSSVHAHAACAWLRVHLVLFLLVLEGRRLNTRRLPGSRRVFLFFKKKC